MATVDQIFSQNGLWKWYSSGSTNNFNGSSEKGEDFSTAFGTKVGAVAPGKVIALIHNNNAINDIVIVQNSSGTWLYQHITAHVKVGDNVGVGTVVGTENGMPPDQYSTGPHIEVRYIPTKSWKTGVDQWLQGWINPASIFSSIGGKDATNPTFTTPGTGNNPLGTLDFSWITNWIASLKPLWDWLSNPVRVIKMAAGILLIGGAIFLLIAPEAEKTAVKAAKVAAVAA